LIWLVENEIEIVAAAALAAKVVKFKNFGITVVLRDTQACDVNKLF
jgi:hypothetical protein